MAGVTTVNIKQIRILGLCCLSFGAGLAVQMLTSLRTRYISTALDNTHSSKVIVVFARPIGIIIQAKSHLIHKQHHVGPSSYRY